MGGERAQALGHVGRSHWSRSGAGLMELRKVDVNGKGLDVPTKSLTGTKLRENKSHTAWTCESAYWSSVDNIVERKAFEAVQVSMSLVLKRKPIICLD